ncbi:MAG: type II toxin-antitoxin system VapC family toxin [Saprospiraceae bacterium]|nr:type II toxin-antitoxin system VapC family toxin [Saprospiraceae bacterium]
MSGRKLLLDSNIVIYIAQRKLSPTAFVQAGDALFLSDISYMETLGYPFTDAAEKQETETFLSILYRLPVDEVVIQKVIELRQLRRIKLPDAIIAATGLVHDCTVVTRNVSDFVPISGLKVLNPWPI